MKYLPLLYVLALHVFGLVQVTVGEAELSRGNALLNCLLDLKDVNTGVGGRASQNVLRRMENNTCDLCGPISSLELLNHLSAIGAVDFDNVSST